MSGTPWSAARRILCVRLDSLGDVLMTGPALRALKEARPDRRLTLLTSAAGAAAGPLLPWVDETLVYDAPWLKATAPRASAAPDLAMVERLRGMSFDAAAIFTVYSQNPLPSAMLCYLAGIPLRLAHCRENPYQLLSDWVPEHEPERGVRHEVRRQLDLVAAAGCMTADERMALRVPEAGRRSAAALLAEFGIDGERPWAVVHPGASAPSRRYPAASFTAACATLAREHGWQLVFSGGADEGALVDGIRAGLGAGSHSAAGRLDLAGLAALLAQAPLLICNNTGPAHLAAALGTPVVDLYALTNPQHTPWQVPSRVLYRDVPCRNCYKSVCPQGHHECLLGVAPETVADAALSLMEETRAGFTARKFTSLDGARM